MDRHAVPRARRGGLRTAALIALLGATIGLPAAAESRAPRPSPAKAAEHTLTPVTQSVLSPPRWYDADDGRFHLQYELELTNAVPVPVTVTSLRVLRADGGRIKTVSGGRLEAAMSLLATPAEPTTVLPPSSVGIVWVDLSFARTSGTRAETPATSITGSRCWRSERARWSRPSIAIPTRSRTTWFRSRTRPRSATM